MNAYLTPWRYEAQPEGERVVILDANDTEMASMLIAYDSEDDPYDTMEELEDRARFIVERVNAVSALRTEA